MLEYRRYKILSDHIIAFNIIDQNGDWKNCLLKYPCLLIKSWKVQKVFLSLYYWKKNYQNILVWYLRQSILWLYTMTLSAKVNTSVKAADHARNAVKNKKQIKTHVLQRMIVFWLMFWMSKAWQCFGSHHRQSHFTRMCDGENRTRNRTFRYFYTCLMHFMFQIYQKF